MKSRNMEHEASGKWSLSVPSQEFKWCSLYKSVFFIRFSSHFIGSDMVEGKKEE